MTQRNMVCGGAFDKKDCGVEFFYALKNVVDSNGRRVTVLHAVDKNGCHIEKGNLIVLSHNSDDDVLFCDDINPCLELPLDGDYRLCHDEACISDNTYIG